MTRFSLLGLMISMLRNFSFLHSPIDHERFKASYMKEDVDVGRPDQFNETVFSANEVDFDCGDCDCEETSQKVAAECTCRTYSNYPIKHDQKEPGNPDDYLSNIIDICDHHRNLYYYDDDEDDYDDPDSNDEECVSYDEPRDRNVSTSRIREIKNLIKHETMNGDGFAVYYLIIGTILQNHLLIKTLIQLIWIGKNEQRSKYLNSIYYPNMAGAIEGSARYQPTLFTFTVFNYIFWKYNLFRLIRKSISNRYDYITLSLSQINLAYLASFQWTFDCEIRNSLLALIKYTIMTFQNKSLNDLWEDKILKRFEIDTTSDRPREKKFLGHLMHYDAIEHSDPIGLQDQDHWLKLMIYAQNPIEYAGNFDFFKSHLSREQQESFFRLEIPKTNSKTWQIAKPLHRVDVHRLGLVIFVVQFFIASHMTGCSFYLLVMSALELLSSDAEDTMTSGVAIDPGESHAYSSASYAISFIRVMKPYKFIRLIENFIFYLTLVVPQASYISFCIDGLMVLARVENVSRLARHQVRLLTCATTISQRRKRDWSAQMHHLVQLVKLLSYEFNDVRQQHIIPIHLLVVSACVIVPQLCSLILMSNNIWEQLLLAGGLLLTMMPIITIVAISAVSELFFRRLLESLHEMMVNQNGCLSVDDVKLALRGASFISSAEDRAIVLFCQHPINAGFIIPFFTLILSAIYYQTIWLHSNR